jgi:hypothetical protein
MASFTHIYTDIVKRAATDEPRARYGGPRRPQLPTTSYERSERYGPTDYHGSHMPLDTGVHWEWRNPLNILPGLILLLMVLALLMLVIR